MTIGLATMIGAFIAIGIVMAAAAVYWGYLKGKEEAEAQPGSGGGAEGEPTSE